MNSDLKQALEHIAQGVVEQRDALSTLSDQVAVIESQQHEVNTETVRILALIAEVIHEQGIFANEFNNLCRVWNPKFHADEPMPTAISRRLRQWHYLFSSRVHYLTQAAMSLVKTTKSYKEATQRTTSHIQSDWKHGGREYYQQEIITSSITGHVLTKSKQSELEAIKNEADKIVHRSQQINNEIEKNNQESKSFNEQYIHVNTAHGDVQKLFEDFNPIKEMADALERASIERCSISSSLSLRVSGILSSSTALEMAMSYEHLMDCAEAILSDFSCSTQEDRQPFVEWEISTPDPPANGSHDGAFVVLRDVIVSQDSKRLICTVAVKDVVSKQPIVGRLTFDDWQTELELQATHHDKNEPMPQLPGFHHFKFDIDISGEAQCRAKDMLLRVRYTFKGENYWNTSDGKDFRVHFKADKLALNQVLADLQTGLDEIKLHGNIMQNFRLLEDRDDYHEMMKPRLSDM
ncbi:uncharacterized protein FFUJ_05282 [Fusarium fujikuroi IMI 58289]|uniref:CBM21 domain-containing protein n=1 Tax=Gibberella fujikuroi (strain CBS 195.34 / IMI 58289 / NRRL A-6831) TaxID=1279085 RepID=S0DRU6_GIBF5|nr:uncharacterized protein FFUJ_05282 [Fusarium fujikuroi IMI 58289]CCT65166.1 uncharacterized protein FFUJ_05282 [Fusarium fujikuroi IMI 58289]